MTPCLGAPAVACKCVFPPSLPSPPSPSSPSPTLPSPVSITQVAEETAKKIETASQLYRPCSVRSSILYFVLNDLRYGD